MRVRGLVLGSMLALSACSHEVPKPALGPPPVLPEPKRVVRRKPPPEWFWEAIDPELRAGAPKGVDLPAAEVVRTEGAARLWDELGPEGQERLRRDGVAVLASREHARAKMGVFYTELRAARIPYVVTLDALFYAVHVAHERALAEVEDAVVAPTLDALVTGLSARLGAAEKGSDTEIAEALRVARGVMAVAAALSGFEPPADLASVAQAERALVDAHAGPRTSPLLGVPIDYARFAVPSGAARPSTYKALAWLATAPLALVARTEARGAQVDVATARTQARAAMILARLVDHEGGDPKLHELHARLAKLLAFVWGPPDDLAPAEIADMAAAVEVDLGKPDVVSNVAKVDRVRKKAAKHRVPRVFDGAGVPGVASMRLFGGHAPVDSALLTELAAPAIPARSLPSTLDVAAWLGHAEARACLADENKGGAAGYDAALERMRKERPDDAIHASVHGSLLDALAGWLDAKAPSPAVERVAIESALAAWTLIRHDGRAMARGKPLPAPATARELEVPGGALPAFVDAQPVAIARLLATVRQMERGLGALGAANARSPGMASLAEVEDVLALALRVATRAANDEPIAPEDTAALASVPARLARLETDADAQVPVSADVYTDLRSGRSLTSATGLVERAVVLVRQPGTARLHVAVGAHIAHHELVDPIGERTTDASLRARLDQGVPRGTYVKTFLIGP